jgi:CheY-like chemotaxis protein
MLSQTTSSRPSPFPLFRALVVDDERVIRSVLRRALGGAGFEVVEAPNGEAALGLSRLQHFDLVISDVQMPRMGGLELLRHLKVEQPQLPVILISGHFELLNGQRPGDFGALAVLQKPFSLEEVQRAALRAADLRPRPQCQSVNPP